MDLDKVKQMIDLAKSEGLSSLKYEDKNFEVAFEFAQAKAPVRVLEQPVNESSQQIASKKENTNGYREVKSPFVGTFYRSPSPDSDPYVKEGDKVSSGQTLCIVEAMKIMNEIESEVSGEIVEVCVENETFVEFGQTLFYIK